MWHEAHEPIQRPTFRIVKKAAPVADDLRRWVEAAMGIRE